MREHPRGGVEERRREGGAAREDAARVRSAEGRVPDVLLVLPPEDRRDPGRRARGGARDDVRRVAVVGAPCGRVGMQKGKR